MVAVRQHLLSRNIARIFRWDQLKAVSAQNGGCRRADRNGAGLSELLHGGDHHKLNLRFLTGRPQRLHKAGICVLRKKNSACRVLSQRPFELFDSDNLIRSFQFLQHFGTSGRKCGQTRTIMNYSRMNEFRQQKLYCEAMIFLIFALIQGISALRQIVHNVLRRGSRNASPAA